jgi:hypothetical protein
MCATSQSSRAFIIDLPLPESGRMEAQRAPNFYRRRREVTAFYLSAKVGRLANARDAIKVKRLGAAVDVSPISQDGSP